MHAINNRLLLIAGVLLLLIGMAACSDNSTGGADNSGTSPATPAPSTAGTAAPEPPKAIREITVLMSDSPVQPLIKDSPALQEMLKATNIKVNLEPVPSSDFNAKKSTLIATNNIPDVVRATAADITTFASTGIFLNLSPYIDEFAPNFKKRLEEEPEAHKLKIDGDFYGFPVIANKANANIYGSLPMIRTDILQALQLPAPTSFDELYEVLAAFKTAYPDSYPWTVRNGSQYTLRFLAYSFGGGYDIYYEPEQDKYIYGTSTEGFKEAIAYLNKLYKGKLLDPNFTNTTQQQWTENLSSGKSMFFYDNYTFATNYNASLQQVDPGAYFDMLPVLTDKHGRQRNYVGNPSNLGTNFVISSKAKNPEEIVKLFDWMYSDEGMYATNFGELNQHYTLDNGKVTIKQEVLDEFKDKQDPYRAMQSALGTGLLSFAVLTDDTPITVSSGDDFIKWTDLVRKQYDENKVVIKPLDPPFTEEERERLQQIGTKVTTLLDQNIDKFILGTRPLSELDAFAKEVADGGGTIIEDIYNQAWTRMK